VAGARGDVTPLLAFCAVVLGALALVQLGAGLTEAARTRAAGLASAIAEAVDSLLKLGREGREPGAVERRRLLLLGAGASFAAGTVLVGPVFGALFALSAPVIVSRTLRARRLAYRRAVERAAPAIATALADALAGGHSLRAALAEAGSGVGGAGGAELHRTAAALGAGERTEAALEALRRRCPSAALDVIVAASLVHRRSGGDLAGLLRELARSFEDEQRVAAEARVATAQARFTGLVVVLLPAGGALLAELAAPGFLAGLVGGPLTAWLVGLALGLQVAAAVLIRRIGRVVA
jgi:tight adherence protein B